MATTNKVDNSQSNAKPGEDNKDEPCKICCNDYKDLVLIGDYNARCYPVHKSLLIITSGYFQSFYSRKSFVQREFGPIYITDVEPSALVQCLDFMYTGYLDINSKNLRNLAEAALVLKMYGVWECCVDYAATNVAMDSFFDLRMMAASTICVKLLHATEIFALCNFERLMTHEEFALIDKILMVFLLKNKKVKMIPEHKVYEAVIAWINFTPNKRKQHLSELLNYVALEQLPIDYLRECVHAEPLVMNDAECRNLLEKALFSHIQPDLVTDDGSDTLMQDTMVMFDQGRKDVVSYDPWSGKWKDFAICDFEFDGKCIAVTVEKCVYIMGENGRVFRLDTDKNTWREMAKMGTERGDPRAVVLDGMIYVSGGTVSETNKSMRTAERFDPKKNLWEKLQSMKKPRSKHCLASSRGFVYAIGGLNNNNTAVKLVERWGPSSGGWINVAPLKRPRSGAVSAVKEDSIYIFGGTFTPDISVEVLNPTVSGWTTINVTIPKNFVAACVSGEDIYVVCSSDLMGNEKYELHLITFDDEPVIVERIDNIQKFGCISVLRS
uniref:kelch-like protein 20 n=1 Tax=Styela clava TaxID=7725 RepID=UPI0019397F1E|nr:kelch-like protein 20 [Styela clava]